jgi:hypothetical protein
LPHGEHPWFVLVDDLSVDDDVFLFVLGSSVHLRAIASFGLVSAAFIEQLPIFLGKVIDKVIELVGAYVGMLFLEVE